MRVLVASDGSSPARVALELMASLHWEPGTQIRVLEVAAAPARNAGTSSGVTHAPERLRDGLTIQHEVAYGTQVVDEIVDSTARWDADLVVTGSRGQGAIATMLLGSVAAGVADGAGRPVLVARRSSCARVLLADDGSESALQARRVVARWAVFRGLEVAVVSVAHVTPMLHSGIAPTMLAEAHFGEEEIAAEVRAAHDELAEASLEELRRAGIHAKADVRMGDPAAEILAATQAAGSDLIVMGSRGRTGVTRALLGSVARSVLLRAPASVLIVRGDAGQTI